MVEIFSAPRPPGLKTSAWPVDIVQYVNNCLILNITDRISHGFDEDRSELTLDRIKNDLPMNVLN